MRKLCSFLPSLQRSAYKDAAGFVASSFLYFLSLVLYTWSTPAWFSLFPRASAFRFILAVGVYCLSCMLFSGVCFLDTVCGCFDDSFFRKFFMSFVPVLVFSILVLAGGGLSLQHLQLVVRISDGYVYAVFCLSTYAAGKKKAAAQDVCRPLRMVFLYGLFQTASALFSLLPFSPGFVTAMCRIIALFLFLFYEVFRPSVFSVQNPDTAGGTADGGIRSVAGQYGLSPREFEVFALLCSGKTNEEIAAALFISLSTVKTHLSAVFMKTGTHNRLEAAALCRKN